MIIERLVDQLQFLGETQRLRRIGLPARRITSSRPRP